MNALCSMEWINSAWQNASGIAGIVTPVTDKGKGTSKGRHPGISDAVTAGSVYFIAIKHLLSLNYLAR
jgi:hypothetical protein